LRTIVLVSIMVIVGCKSPPDRIAYNTIGSIDATATAAYDGYADMVISKQIGTNDLTKVSHAYNDLKHGLLIAATSSAQGTNALVPLNLFSNATELANLIIQVEGNK